MEKILEGVRTFQDHVFRDNRELYQHLAARQQKPLALFITCSDSRVNPNLLTQTEPGDLFILRNAGNIIPPYGSANGGEGATVEYAVSVLGITNVIVCGHSHCGAMQALLNLGDLRELPAVAAWFSHAEATRRIARAHFAHLDPEERYRRTICQNVLTQLDNLRTHPAVAVGLARGELHLYGWVYIIETGEVLGYQPDQGRFVPLNTTPATPVPVATRLADTPLP